MGIKIGMFGLFPALVVFGSVFLACGLSLNVRKLFSAAISKVFDTILVTSYYCYEHHPRTVTVGGIIIVSMIGLKALGYRAFLKIAITLLVAMNNQIKAFIKNASIDVTNVDGETKLFNALYPLFLSIKNQYISKMRSYGVLPADFFDQLLNGDMFKNTVIFLISIFITKNANDFTSTKSPDNGNNDNLMLLNSLKLKEGAIDQFGNVYQTIRDNLNSIDEAAIGGFALSSDEHPHVHLFDQKNLQQFTSSLVVPNLNSALVAGSMFAPTFNQLQLNETSGISIQPMRPISAKL